MVVTPNLFKKIEITPYVDSGLINGINTISFSLPETPVRPN